MLEKGNGGEDKVAESHGLHRRKAANVDVVEEAVVS